MIVGIAGTIGAGKDTIANFFVKNYNFKKIVMSNFLREIEKHRRVKPTRANLRKLQLELRKKYGEEILMEMLLSKIVEKNLKRVVISGIRTLAEIKFLKKKLNAKIIFVDAKPEVRFLRIKKRGRIGDPKTYEQFLHEDAIENAMFSLKKVKKFADFVIDNSFDVKNMERQIRRIAKKMKLK
ncbi:MAG: AAA family ATPase [Candidatus Pacearchaeota archaeon]|nr:AAA family ATPase [Candidatus Pacearchaeota archaeon]